MKFILLFLAALASQATQAANLRTGKSIVDLALTTPDLSTLLTALKAADLVDMLSGDFDTSPGPFTVFAPTNEAFAALPADTLSNLLKPENKAQLVDLLTYHVSEQSTQHLDMKHTILSRLTL